MIRNVIVIKPHQDILDFIRSIFFIFLTPFYFRDLINNEKKKEKDDKKTF